MYSVHKVRQVIFEYKDNIVLVYCVDVIVLSQYKMSNCQHVHVVESCGNCSLNVLKTKKERERLLIGHSFLHLF
jgi:hypothetical protein